MQDEVEEEPIAQRESQREEYPLPLSYNQINCLENVHRLLKSQSQVDQTIKEIKQEIPLVLSLIDLVFTLNICSILITDWMKF